MKLGEAKKRLDQISLCLIENKIVLASGPRTGIVETLDECTNILKEQQTLNKKISDTEAVTLLEKNTLEDVNSVIKALCCKIKLIEILTKRNDLDEVTKEVLFNKLKLHRNSLNNLELSASLCIWKTELIE